MTILRVMKEIHVERCRLACVCCVAWVCLLITLMVCGVVSLYALMNRPEHAPEWLMEFQEGQGYSTTPRNRDSSPGKGGAMPEVVVSPSPKQTVPYQVGSTTTASTTTTVSGIRTVSDDELTEVVGRLWNDDTYRLKDTEFELNLQGQTTLSETEDKAPEKLFKAVHASIEARSWAYITFLQLLDNYVSETKSPEVRNDKENQEVNAFLDSALSSYVMLAAQRFLAQKGYIQNNKEDFKQLLLQLWFTPYSRSPKYNTTDSSGFEHVFVGETRGSKVTGLHNWIQFYKLEKENHANYMGYLSQKEPRILSVQFKWNEKIKKQASFFLGSSPEFDLALYTVCVLVRTNQPCSFNIDNLPVTVQVWDVSHVDGIQVDLAYIAT